MYRVGQLLTRLYLVQQNRCKQTRAGAESGISGAAVAAPPLQAKLNRTPLWSFTMPPTGLQRGFITSPLCVCVLLGPLA